ncbi:DUF805 domain-containing protein [Sinomonas sp. P10A9]|uniref:DUF805 domain-containing protein n=1 Tax=Sinomonas puerhi TaxID=3238584 RepID=A0AB39L1H2_9MICC
MTSQQPPYAAGSPVHPLELPYYGAPPVEAFTRVWKKYAVFAGRASRSEYWWWALASAIVSAVLNAISPTVVNGQTTGSSVLGGLWFLVSVVPSLAVAARRLHDVNASAWLLLLALIPVLGWIALIVMLAQRENPMGQRFDRYPGKPVAPYQQQGYPPYQQPPYPPYQQPPYPPQQPPTAPPPPPPGAGPTP